MPNLFVVGAPKCGTTSLVEYLSGHPRIFFGQKEPAHFCTDLGAYRQPRTHAAYLALFSDAGPEHRYVGEGTTRYLYSRVAVPRILELEPSARLIAMVRNPLEMVPSLHAQALHSFDEDVEDFVEAWRLQPDRARGASIPDACRHPDLLQYGEQGRLGAQIERLLDVAPEEQVHVIVFDDLVRDAAAVYERVLGFLGLASDGRERFPRVNPSRRRRFRRLARWIERPSDRVRRLGRAAGRWTGVDWGRLWGRFRTASRGVTSRRKARDPLPEAFRLELRDAFRDDVARLSRVLERDLSHWIDP